MVFSLSLRTGPMTSGDAHSAASRHDDQNG